MGPKWFITVHFASFGSKLVDYSPSVYKNRAELWHDYFLGFGTICLEHGTIILEFSFKKIVQKWKQIFFETNRVQIKLKKLKKSSKIH